MSTLIRNWKRVAVKTTYINLVYRNWHKISPNRSLLLKDRQYYWWGGNTMKKINTGESEMPTISLKEIENRVVENSIKYKMQ